MLIKKHGLFLILRDVTPAFASVLEAEFSFYAKKYDLFRSKVQVSRQENFAILEDGSYCLPHGYLERLLEILGTLKIPYLIEDQPYKILQANWDALSQKFTFRYRQEELLKILEEPPKDVHFFMAVTKLGDMLDTIQSRTVVWRLNLPTKEQLNTYFADKPDAHRAKAIAIGESRIGLITALLDDDENHELLHAIDTAKEILGENHFERMIRVDALSKDAVQTALVLEALELVCKAALENAASKNNHTVKQWHKRLGYVTQAEDWLQTKVQAKLVLSHLFMRI